MGAIELLSPLDLSRITTDFRPNQSNTLWITMTRAPLGKAQNFSVELLQQIAALHESMRINELTWTSGGRRHQIHYSVLRSAHPDYFSLGGDLAHFRDCIRRGDRRALQDYSMSCMDMIYEWSNLPNRKSLVTLALIQGRALGGGFETALAADFIIAEEHSEFGFPEILFGLFPCTGGMSLLARRVGVYEAERMMSSGRVYSAAELHAKGIIDMLCSKGGGEQAAEKFILEHTRHRTARLALQRGRHRLSPLRYDELREVVEEWVEAAVVLPESDLRVMDMLVAMQQATVSTA